MSSESFLSPITRKRLNGQLGVHSEVGHLDVVLMHRSGDELTRLTATNHEPLLFDAIPSLHDTQASHDIFAQYLRDNDVTVLYVSDVLYEALVESFEACNALIDGVVENSSGMNKDQLSNWLHHRTVKQLARDVIVGVARTREELGETQSGLILFNECQCEFIVPPLPNLLFSRDAFSILGEQVFIWEMTFFARRNEPLLMQIIFQYHPELKLNIVNWKCQAERGATIEGGDVAFLGQGILLIGVGQRTNTRGVEALVRTKVFNKVIAVKLPEQRVYMHLDMVLSQVGPNAFTFHGPLAYVLQVFDVQLMDEKVKLKDSLTKCQWVSYGHDIVEALKQILGQSLIFYDAQDEQTSIQDQAQCRHNVFALNEHHIMTYDNNENTSKSIYAQMTGHIERPCRVGLVPTRGLIEGGGGAHCMTNAISRRRIDNEIMPNNNEHNSL